MWCLLAVVAAAAAVLSFSALRDLAQLCGFTPGLAWLLPVVIDAGAASGVTVWMGGTAPDVARRYARAQTLLLLASSVTGNAVVHALTAYKLAPAWGLVVAVSGVAPVVLGAVVHLAVLVAQGRTEVGRSVVQPPPVPVPVQVPVLTPAQAAQLATVAEPAREWVVRPASVAPVPKPAPTHARRVVPNPRRPAGAERDMPSRLPEEQKREKARQKARDYRARKKAEAAGAATRSPQIAAGHISAAA